MWNPEQYQRFGDERSRPFFELVSQIPDLVNSAPPQSIVDLGCGPGHLTATLAHRWKTSTVIGLDNDSAMLQSAGSLRGSELSAHTNLSFAYGDLSTWTALQHQQPSIDVIIANAALQWDVNHLSYLPTLFEQVTRGGYLAFQVPGNLDDPHHQAIRSLRAEPKWSVMPGIAALPARTHISFSAVDYLNALAPLGAIVNAWETSYVHILQGEDPILEWVKGTGLRPVLNALLTDEARHEFCHELAPMLRAAYPTYAYGTPFPFRRVFTVARRV
jgi:trans-aconitate 2-methyltransferase